MIPRGSRSRQSREIPSDGHDPRRRILSVNKTKPYLALALALSVSARLLSQPAIPTSGKLEGIRNLETTLRILQVDVITAAPAALSVDITTRAESRAFYNAIFSASEGVPSGWTGSLSGTPGTSATGTAGTTTTAFQAALASIAAICKRRDLRACSDKIAIMQEVLLHTGVTRFWA